MISNSELKSYANKHKVFVFKKIDKHSIYPKKATKHSCGVDLYCHNNLTIPPQKCVLVNTGLCVFIPENYELQIRPRSGLSLLGIIAVFGTVDSDYSGMPIGVMLFNTTQQEYLLKQNTRIAQAVKSIVCDCKIVNSSLETICESFETRSGGFGSTGEY